MFEDPVSTKRLGKTKGVGSFDKMKVSRSLLSMAVIEIADPIMLNCLNYWP